MPRKLYLGRDGVMEFVNSAGEVVATLDGEAGTFEGVEVPVSDADVSDVESIKANSDDDTILFKDSSNCTAATFVTDEKSLTGLHELGTREVSGLKTLTTESCNKIDLNKDDDCTSMTFDLACHKFEGMKILKAASNDELEFKDKNDNCVATLNFCTSTLSGLDHYKRVKSVEASGSDCIALKNCGGTTIATIELGGDPIESGRVVFGRKQCLAVNPPAIDSWEAGLVAVTVSGAAVGKSVIVNPPATIGGDVAIMSAYCSDTDEVTIRLLNVSEDTLNLDELNWDFTVLG